MTDQTAPQSRVPKKDRGVRFWFATAALVPYGAVIVALLAASRSIICPKESRYVSLL
jgi:hypothetical protein